MQEEKTPSNLPAPLIPSQPSGNPALRLNQPLESEEDKRTGSLLAPTARAESKDCGISLIETSVPAPVVRPPNILDATDSEMIELNRMSELLRPNQICDKALKGTAHREERKDLAIQSPIEAAQSSPELKTDSPFPKNAQTPPQEKATEENEENQQTKEETSSHLKSQSTEERMPRDEESAPTKPSSNEVPIFATFNAPVTNQLVVEPIGPIDPISESDVREIFVRTDPRCTKAYSLGHLKLGLHATVDADPSWQYALVDGGCNNNLISLNALKHLADFNKAQITQSTSKRIQTANNDASQVIEGKIKLHFSLIDFKGKRITLKSDFLIVSGLTHDIFVGTPLLNSPQVNHITKHSIFFNPTDAFKNPHEVYSKTSPLLQEVRITHHLNAKAKATKSRTIPPKSAIRMETNCSISMDGDPDVMNYFQPSEKFHATFPAIHIMQQTVFPSDTENVDVFLINTSSRPIKVHRNTFLGTIKSFAKVDVIIEPMSNFVNAENAPEPDDVNLSQLNTVKIEQMHKGFEFVPVPATVCNHAFTSHMHEHPNTEAEERERQEDFKNLGYFQKTVSETLDESKNIPSMEYTGEHQFKPKSDEELLSEINLDHLSAEHRALAIAMLKRNITAFQRHPLDIGCCKGVTAFAPLTTPNPPILYAKYVPIPLAYKEPAQKLIDEYCAAGVLAPTNKPCKFTSNIFIIPKKDGTFRLIFDGRILSKYCQQLPIALGNFDEIFSNLTEKSIVSKLDLSKAYDQLAVDDETSQLLSFFGPDARRYVYRRSGQGLKFSSFFLNQAMDTILFGMKNVHSYCDDVFVTGNSTFEAHLDQLEEVIQRFQAHNVKLNIAKLEISPPNLDFLGLTWSKDKLSIPKSKITAYTNLKKPKSIKEARFLVNSLSFYRRFIPKFSDTIHPILELIKENEKTPKNKRSFKWTEKHQSAVDKLVKQIENGMSIYLPRKDRMFIIHTDASYVAAAATVSQVDDEGHTRLVAAVSRTFNTSERRTAPVHKEILSLLYCLTSLNYILRGHFLRVFADAKSMTLLKTCSTSSPYLSRLAMELSIYDFELFHIPGKLNIEADALSRMTKTQDKILSTDKQKNTAMTKEESLLFLEYLTIPVDHHFTQSDIRHMITSEPLRSELKAKVKARYASAKKSGANNGPHTVKSKKTREPRYVRSHPLERKRSHSRSRKYAQVVQTVTNPSKFDRLANRSPSPPPPSPSIPNPLNQSPCSRDTVIHSEGLYNTESNRASVTEQITSEASESEEDSDYDPDSESDEDDYFIPPPPCEEKTCLLHCETAINLAKSDPQVSQVSQIHETVSQTPNRDTASDADSFLAELPDTQSLMSVLTDNDRYYCQANSASVLNDESETRPALCNQTDSPSAKIANDLTTRASDEISLSSSLSSFDHSLLTPSSTLCLNNTVGVHNVRLSDSIADLETRSSILTTGQLSPNEFAEAQRLDQKIQEIKDSRAATNENKFRERQGILCKKVKDSFLPILPRSLEKFLFNCEHFHVTAGHRSATNMIADLKKKFYVFNLKTKVTQFCKDCYICAITKTQRMRPATQGETEKPNTPKQILSFDIFGGLPEDDQGYKWVYTFIDNFSLYVINIKAKSKSTKEILAAFLHVFASISAIPETVVSDNETALMTKEALDFFNSFGIKHNPGAAHAHWRLLSETAAIKKTKAFLRATCKTNPRQPWTEALSLATYALNNTKTVHGFSPAEILFGNHKRSRLLLNETEFVADYDEYMNIVKEAHKQIIDQVREARSASTKMRTDLINRHRQEKTYEVGQLVWLKSVATATSTQRALKVQNRGPFKIVRKVNEHTYHLAKLANPTKCDRIAHASHLQPYRSQLDMTPINLPGIAWNLN